MQPDVYDDTHRPEQARVEHAEARAGILERTELVHQPLGIQPPAFVVAGYSGHEALESAEAVAVQDGVPDLQVMAWYQLVEDEDRISPDAQAGRQGTPDHLAADLEPLTRWVVSARRPVRSQQFDAEATQLWGDIEHGRRLLQPAGRDPLESAPVAFRAVRDVGGIGIKDCHRLINPSRAVYLPGGRVARGGYQAQFVPPPVVGLVEVQVRACMKPHVKLEVISSHGLGGIGDRSEFPAEESREGSVGLIRAIGGINNPVLGNGARRAC